MKKILILGGGISGLSAAWFLSKNPQFEITLLEKSHRVGGWIDTVEKDGFLFERGPRGFRSKGKGASTLNLIHELNLTSSLIQASPHSRRRFIYFDGKLHKFSPFFLLSQGLLGSLLKERFTPPSLKNDDETIGSFFERRFGKKFTQKMVVPFLRGISGGDPYQFSLLSLWPFLKQWEKKYGSIFKGYLKERSKEPNTYYSFKEGMQTLVSTLRQALSKKIDLRLNTEVLKIQKHEKEFLIETTSGHFKADFIVTTLPLFVMSHLLENPLPPLPYSTITTVNLGWQKPLLSRLGYGYLVPSFESDLILGMTWDSHLFPAQSKNHQTRLCLMLKGEIQENEALNIAKKALKEHLHISEAPKVFDIHTSKQAIPQYPLNHFSKKLNLPGIQFIGTHFEGLGVNDCIHDAEKAAKVWTHSTFEQ